MKSNSHSKTGKQFRICAVQFQNPSICKTRKPHTHTVDTVYHLHVHITTPDTTLAEIHKQTLSGEETSFINTRIFCIHVSEPKQEIESLPIVFTVLADYD